jgi:branched-chain amino acid transport system ATP-binding protein
MAVISVAPVLELRDVSMRFGGVQAIKGVTFQVMEGELFALIGPNGAGKSTLFNCINGLYKPTEGKVLFQGKDITGDKPFRIAHRGIARTFQNIALFHRMSVLENLLLGRNPFLCAGVLRGGLFLGGALREELKNREAVEEIIDFLEIEGYRKAIVGSLPFGIQRRIELGRALAMKPKLLLLDEPVSGMNSEEREDMARFILDIKEELGTTVVLIDHDMGVVMNIADRIAVLNFGVKIAEGPPVTIVEDPYVIQAYLGEEEEAP